MDFAYVFPAVCGRQANKEYYIAMVPLKMLKHIFLEEDEYILPQFRAQRKINETRIPAIRDYILNNRDTYVFSALSASIDGDFEFTNSGQTNVGYLKISIDAKFLINDGQHRKAAILEAIERDKTLGDETISIVFFRDCGLSRSQQMFTDLNKHAVKTSNSISELYDSRDELAIITLSAIHKIPFLEKYTDLEKDILGKYSSNLFTLNTIYNANRKIFVGVSSCRFTKYEETFLYEYWKKISLHMLPWKELEQHVITKTELREQYIVTQSVIIQAFGRLGHYFYTHPELDLSLYATRLEDIDWKRNSENWIERIIKQNGRIINNETAIILACNRLKILLDIKLAEDELRHEQNLMRE